MRFLRILPLFLLLTACTKTDRDLINGKWTLQEVAANGQKIYTADKKEQQQIVDNIIREQMAMIPDEMKEDNSIIRSTMLKQMEMMGKTTLQINSDDSYVGTSPGMDGMNETKGKIAMDLNKKELSMISGSETEVVSYELSDDKLVLTSAHDGETAKMTFKRTR